MGSHWGHLESFGDPLGSFGAIWGHFGVIWGHLGSFEDIWGLLGTLWGHLGSIWGHFGVIWGHLGTLWGHLGSLWGHLGTLWGHLGSHWGHLGPFGDTLGSPEVILWPRPPKRRSLQRGPAPNRGGRRNSQSERWLRPLSRDVTAGGGRELLITGAGRPERGGGAKGEAPPPNYLHLGKRPIAALAPPPFGDVAAG